MNDLRTNHFFLLEIANLFAKVRGNPKILDFGCGTGLIVKEGLKKGLDIYGADIFYGNEDIIRQNISKQGFSPTRISEIKHDKLDFKDNTFDLVLSNQVFEHVKDLNPVLREIQRILTPDGYLFCIFDTRNVVIRQWRFIR